VPDAVTDERQRKGCLALAEVDELALAPRPRRESLRADVQRLEQVRLPRAVRADDEDDAGREPEVESAIRAVVPKRDAADDQLSRRAGSA
jgi:hypothetical protein